MYRLFLAAIFAFTIQGAAAAVVYVRDTLYVPLRGGQSPEHRILHRGLKSGTPLTLLSQNEESGFSQVRMEDGLEGWIQTQYLADAPIAADRLTAATNALDDAARRAEEAEAVSATLRDTNAALDAEVLSLNAAVTELEAELSRVTTLAANVIEIDDTNKALSDEKRDLVAEIEALNQANVNLDDVESRQWFLVGAGTVAGGLFLGFLLARRIYSRRSHSGWS